LLIYFEMPKMRAMNQPNKSAISNLQFAICSLLVIASLVTANGAGTDLRLIDAVKAGNHDAVRLLLKGTGKAVANAAEADGTTGLHWAVRADDLETVRLLLHAGADAKAVNRYGVSPLSLAAMNGTPAVVEALLNAGADPNASLSDGQTMIMIAARTGTPEAIAMLAAHGANVNARESVLGENALIWAAAEDHEAAIRVLASRGADVNARSNVLTFPRRDFGDGKSGRFTVLPRGGWTPVMYAARQDAQGALRALADAGADLNLTDPDGTNALTLAVINAHYDAAALLLDKGADPNLADARGMTALYAAVDMNTLDETPGRPEPKPTGSLDSLGMIDALLAHHANPNAPLSATVFERVHNNGDPVLGEGATPLMRAARKADVAAMQRLLAHGADPKATMKGGVNAVMIVSGFGGQVRFAEYNLKSGTEHDDIEGIRLCLEHGADLNAVNDAGQTALHVAAAQRGDDFIRFLVKKGAALDAIDKQGHTPLDVALGAGGGRGRGRVPGVREGTAALLRQLMADRGGSDGKQLR
jgi:ankyrin repeat protein